MKLGYSSDCSVWEQKKDAGLHHLRLSLVIGSLCSSCKLTSPYLCCGVSALGTETLEISVSFRAKPTRRILLFLSH